MEKLMQLSWLYDLYTIAQGVMRAREPAEIYQQILNYVVNGFKAQSGSLAICNVEGCDTLTIIAGIDLPPGVIGSKIRIGEGVLGWVAREGKAVLLNSDASSDPRFHRQRGQREVDASHSSICWPLEVESRIIGVVSVNRHASQPVFTDADMAWGSALLNMVSMVLLNMQLQIEQKRRYEELQRVNRKLEEAHNQLMQSEKMASIGQLAAGVAHEINNPIGYVYSNLGSLEKYMQDALAMIEQYEDVEKHVADEAMRTQLKAAREKLDIGFLKEDLKALMNESREGITRVKKIVQSLKDFSRVDEEEEWRYSDLHKGLDSTLNIAHNEIKYKADVIKEYGELPEVECLSSQLNQVFMNILVNAVHAIEERGNITIRTGQQGEKVWVEIADTGKGIKPEHMRKIFDPFFTTKPVGKGTGLGLSLSYSIVQKHHGRIEVKSEVGKGATFRVWLPVKQPAQEGGEQGSKATERALAK